MDSLDYRILHYLNSFPALDPIFIFFSWIGDILLWIIFAAILYLRKNNNRTWLIYLGLIIIMYILEIIIKSAVQRPRPSDTRLVVPASSYAMPSGHAMRSFASAFYLQKKLPYKWLIWVLAFLISISRIFTGVHYPSDVLVGALIGSVGGLLWTRWETRLKEGMQKYLRQEQRKI